MYGLFFGLTGSARPTAAWTKAVPAPRTSAAPRYVRAESLQAQIEDTQARMLTMLGEMRSTLDETRGHVQSVWTSATARSGAADHTQE